MLPHFLPLPLLLVRLLLLGSFRWLALCIHFICCFGQKKERYTSHIIAIFQLLRPRHSGPRKRGDSKRNRVKYEKLHYTLINTSPGEHRQSASGSGIGAGAGAGTEGWNCISQSRAELQLLQLCVPHSLAIMKIVCGLSGRTLLSRWTQMDGQETHPRMTDTQKDLF